MAEKDVSKKLIDNSPRLLWKPISDKYGVGTPDRCVIVRGEGRVCWVELKHLESLPIRSCKVGLKSHQAKWLEEWKRHGGECYLIIGIGSKEVCIFDSGFFDIFKNGIARERFNVMKFNQVEEYLLYGQKTASC